MPAPREHDIKCRHDFFEHVWIGDKTFAIRKDDRHYQVGDVLLLRETALKPDRIPRWIRARVTYVLSGEPWLARDYVAMSIRVFERGGLTLPSPTLPKPGQ